MLHPLILSTCGQQQPENHPCCSSRLVRVYRAPGMGVRAALVPTEAHGLHTNCRKLWAGGQSTVKTMQLSVWGKLAKEVQQLCQALPAHQNSPGEKGSRAERSQEVSISSWGVLLGSPPGERRANLQVTSKSWCSWLPPAVHVFSKLSSSSYKAHRDIHTGLAK